MKNTNILFDFKFAEKLQLSVVQHFTIYLAPDTLVLDSTQLFTQSLLIDSTPPKEINSFCFKSFEMITFL